MVKINHRRKKGRFGSVNVIGKGLKAKKVRDPEFIMNIDASSYE